MTLRETQAIVEAIDRRPTPSTRMGVFDGLLVIGLGILMGQCAAEDTLDRYGFEPVAVEAPEAEE